MLTYLRYALATICFALSVGCLGLWGQSQTYYRCLRGPTYLSEATFGIFAYGMYADLLIGSSKTTVPWRYESRYMKRESVIRMQEPMKGNYFGAWWTNGRLRRIFLPLWYPALVFALAGIGTLRLGHRFTLRSALIATTVVAGLLGMVVAL